MDEVTVRSVNHEMAGIGSATNHKPSTENYQLFFNKTVDSSQLTVDGSNNSFSQLFRDLLTYCSLNSLRFMKITKKISAVFLLGVFAFACSNNTAVNNGPSSMPTPKVAGPPVYDDEVAVFETDYGSFKIALYPDVAPLHVENFKKLIREKFYDGLGFHRVISDFIIQG